MYNYEENKTALFTDEGQKQFLKIRDYVKYLLGEAGAFRMVEAWECKAGGDTWSLMACVDRLVELGEIREIEQVDCAGQHRIFVKR